MGTSESLRSVTDSTFESEVLQSVRPVLVYFWADWSEECRYMEPLINSTANTLRSSVQFVILDVDENPRMARVHLIQMVPTFLLFAKGEEIDRIEGVTNQKHLSSTIQMHLPDTSEEVTHHTNSVN